MRPVVFLDFDGPLIPLRAYLLPGNRNQLVSQFDPVAAELVNHLVQLADARIVISSTWAIKGREACEEVLRRGGVTGALHEDWMTPRKLSSRRMHEIGWWLEDHPEVNRWVAIDDTPLSDRLMHRQVLCGLADGFTCQEFLKACDILEVSDSFVEGIRTQLDFEKLR